MPSQLTITGSAFVANGTAASTGTTGLAVCNGLTHQLSTSKPVEGSFVGVLASAVGGSCGFRIGPSTAGATQPFNADAYLTISFWMRLRVELPQSLPADNAAMSASQVVSRNDPGFILYGTNSNNGFFLWTQNFAGGGSWSQIWQCGYGYNQWFKVTLRVKKAVSGIAELFINGKCVSYAKGDYSALGTAWDWSWPAFAGCVWEFDGPFEQWSGTDYDTSTPASLLTDARDDVVAMYLANNDYDLHNDVFATGLDCTCTQVSGTTTKTITNVSTTGVNPGFHYRALAGSGSVYRISHTIPDPTSYFADDWVVLSHWPLLYLPSGSSMSIKLYRGAGLGATIDIGVIANTVTVGGVTLCNFPQAQSNSFTIFMNRYGRLAVLATDQTVFPNSGGGRSTWGKVLSGAWSVSGMGGYPNTLTYDVTLGASGARVSGEVFGRRITCFGPDSICDGYITGYTPSHNSGTNVMFNGFTMNTDSRAFLLKPHGYTVPGQPLYYPLYLGRGGLKLSEFVQNVLPGLAEVEGGVRIVLIEGSVNDYGAAATIADAKACVDAVDVSDAALQAWSTAVVGRSLVMTTMIDRPLSTSWSGSPATSAVGVRVAVGHQINTNRRKRFAATAMVPYCLIDVAQGIIYLDHDDFIDTGNPPHFLGGLQGGNQRYYSFVMAGLMTRIAPTDTTTYLRQLAAAKNVTPR